MFRTASRVLLIVALPVISLWGASDGCFNFKRDYFDPLVKVYASGNYYAEADLLYWTHSDCDYDYALLVDAILQTPPSAIPPAITANTDRGTKQFVRPGYGPGIRLHIGFRNDPCTSQDLSYTWIEIKSSSVTKLDTNSTFQPFERSVIISNSFDGEPNKITGQVISRYQRLNLEVLTAFQLGDWGEFVAGGEYMWVSITHYQNSSAVLPSLPPGSLRPEVSKKYTFSGGGIGYQLGFRYRLGECGLHMVGRSALIGLIGRQRATRSGVSTLPNLLVVPSTAFAFNEAVTVPGRTILLPGFEAMAGIGYVHDSKCYTVRITVSYEIHQYVSALSTRIASTDLLPPIGENPLFGSISYGGPALSLEVSY